MNYPIVKYMEQRYIYAERPHIAVIGGGTGASNLLFNLKYQPEQPRLSAIINVSDDGGSSGELVRRGHISLPPGDIRQCISALSGYTCIIPEANEVRYDSGPDKGHVEGNLRLAAEEQLLGSFEAAVDAEAYRMRVTQKGHQILPATLQPHSLVLDLGEGRSPIIGESAIGNYTLKPDDKPRIHHDRPIDANPRAVEALRTADAIVIAPGNHHQSILPVLAIKGIIHAIRYNSDAPLIVIPNLVNISGHTDKWDATHYQNSVAQYIGRNADIVLHNTAEINPTIMRLARISSKNQVGLPNERQMQIAKYIGRPLAAKALREISPSDTKDRNRILHDGALTAQALMQIIRQGTSKLQPVPNLAPMRLAA